MRKTHQTKADHPSSGAIDYPIALSMETNTIKPVKVLTATDAKNKFWGRLTASLVLLVVAIGVPLINYATIPSGGDGLGAAISFYLIILPIAAVVAIVGIILGVMALVASSEAKKLERAN